MDDGPGIPRGNEGTDESPLEKREIVGAGGVFQAQGCFEAAPPNVEGDTEDVLKWFFPMQPGYRASLTLSLMQLIHRTREKIRS